MREYTIVSRSEKETEAAGEDAARMLRDTRGGVPSFVALYGDLGAGKTAFVRGFASVLSPGSRVKSPTYTVVNEYRRGPIPVFHFDFYRLGDARELDSIGFEEYTAQGICIAEWSEKLGEDLPKDALTVTIRKLDADTREITVRTPWETEDESC